MIPKKIRSMSEVQKLTLMFRIATNTPNPETAAEVAVRTQEAKKAPLLLEWGPVRIAKRPVVENRRNTGSTKARPPKPTPKNLITNRAPPHNIWIVPGTFCIVLFLDYFHGYPHHCSVRLTD